MVNGLTERELEVVEAIRAGCHSLTALSHELRISSRTVESHVYSIAEKVPEKLSDKPFLRVILFALDSSSP